MYNLSNLKSKSILPRGWVVTNYSLKCKNSQILIIKVSSLNFWKMSYNSCDTLYMRTLIHRLPLVNSVHMLWIYISGSFIITGRVGMVHSSCLFIRPYRLPIQLFHVMVIWSSVRSLFLQCTRTDETPQYTTPTPLKNLFTPNNNLFSINKRQWIINDGTTVDKSVQLLNTQLCIMIRLLSANRSQYCISRHPTTRFQFWIFSDKCDRLKYYPHFHSLRNK